MVATFREKQDKVLSLGPGISSDAQGDLVRLEIKPGQGPARPVPSIFPSI